VQSDLEARVEDVEKTVGETPHEEEGGDEDDGDNGLTSSQLRSTSHDAVVDALAPSLLRDYLDSRWATALLLVDLLHGGFLRTVHAKELHHGGDWTLVSWIKIYE
jgi:type VI protein secretion system component VasA